MQGNRKNKSNWGGPRQGAGRPAGKKNKTAKKVQMSFKLSPAIASFLRNHSGGDVSQSDLIEAAIIKAYNPKGLPLGNQKEVA